MSQFNDIVDMLTAAATRIPSKELSRLSSIVAAEEATGEVWDSPHHLANGRSFWIWIDPATFPEDHLLEFNALVPAEGNQGYYAYQGDLTPKI